MNLGEVDVYHDGEASANLDSLLKRLDIKAVIIALPIQAQAEVIIKCLEAGKHVLSEKPMSPDVVTGARLVRLYEEQFKPRGLVGAITEVMLIVLIASCSPDLACSRKLGSGARLLLCWRCREARRYWNDSYVQPCGQPLR